MTAAAAIEAAIRALRANAPVRSRIKVARSYLDEAAELCEPEPTENDKAAAKAEVKSLMEDSGYTKAEANAIVRAGGLCP